MAGSKLDIMVSNQSFHQNHINNAQDRSASE